MAARFFGECASDRPKEGTPLTLLLCLLAIVASFWAGKRSLGLGVVGLLTFGYFYGIVRANLLTTGAYFMFDSALVGLYFSQRWTNADPRSRVLKGWIVALMLWPTLMIVLPFQPWLVSLVGLRGAIFFLPMALLGSRLTDKDLRTVSLGLGCLNVAVLGFAAAEYILGVPRFYPLNPATLMIYASGDVAGGFYRIPATFVNAHSYGGTMVSTIPYLIGSWDQAKTKLVRIGAIVGTAAALLGVLLSATRMNFVISAVLVLVAVWNGRMTMKQRSLIVLLVVGLMAVAMGNERMQRFKSLSDTDAVEDRIRGSVNRGFFDILGEYPMGNGLGGGGTSMPYFLEGQIRNPISMENSYALILSEQGLIGLMIWAGFLLWFLSRTKHAFAKGPWATTRRLIWGWSLVGLVSGMIGLGMLTAIPQTAMLLMGMGFISTRVQAQVARAQTSGMRQTLLPQRAYPGTPVQA
jgi:O-Antigen ligase